MGRGQFFDSARPEEHREPERCGQSHEHCHFSMIDTNVIRYFQLCKDLYCRILKNKNKKINGFENMIFMLYILNMKILKFCHMDI